MRTTHPSPLSACFVFAAASLAAALATPLVAQTTIVSPVGSATVGYGLVTQFTHL